MEPVYMTSDTWTTASTSFDVFTMLKGVRPHRERQLDLVIDDEYIRVRKKDVVQADDKTVVLQPWRCGYCKCNHVFLTPTCPQCGAPRED